MNLHAATAARRILAAAALSCAAALAPAAALASPGHASAARASAPACATKGLDVWLDTNGNSATGHTFYQLNFTNLSGSTCTLFGFPGVSAVTLTGTQLGNAAARSGTPHTVTLKNGASTHALVDILNTDFIPPSKCRAVTAAGLKVYPPNQTKSRTAPFPFSACSKTGRTYLTISPVGFP